MPTPALYIPNRREQVSPEEWQLRVDLAAAYRMVARFGFVIWCSPASAPACPGRTMLRNHGLLTVGASVADAFLDMYLFETTCTIQVRAQAGGGALVDVAPGISDTTAARPGRSRGARARGWSGPACCAGWTGACRATTAEVYTNRGDRLSRKARMPSPPLAWNRLATK